MSTGPKRYQVKPVYVQAIEWTGSNDQECAAFLGESFGGVDHAINARTSQRELWLLVKTADAESPSWLSVGFMVVKDADGRVEWFSPKDFAAQYVEERP